jgi:hypothetical protein
MSECQMREILLMKYAEGLLEGMERGDVEVHLSGCPACQQWLNEYRRLKETMQSEEIGDREDEYWERFQGSVLERIRQRGVQGRVSAGMRRGVTPGQGHFFRRYGVAAAVALVAFVLVMGVTHIIPLSSRIGLGKAPIAMTDADMEVSLIMGVEGGTESYQDQERLFKEFLDRKMEETLLGRLWAIDEQTDFLSVLQQLPTNGTKAEDEFYRLLFDIPATQNGWRKT